MEQIFEQYNKSVGDVVKLKKKVNKIRQNQPVKEKKPSYEQNDDGWITVHHKRGDKQSTRRNRKKKKEERLVNFYSFEKKEAKLQRHKELLAKFEEDKKRLQKMREQRKFKI
jgi:ribosomal RNA-processing protein 7